MTPVNALSDLGWQPFFLSQLDLAELDLIPARITSVHRSRLDLLGADGPFGLHIAGAAKAGDFAVGDWILTDGTQILRRLDRKSQLSRGATVHGGETQLIAANVDTLFIVTSCNADFNPARLERYLAIAAEAGTEAVILLTKADETNDPEDFRQQALRLSRNLAVLALDARDPLAAAALTQWCRQSQTVALVGSSGVGKTTLTNTLTGLAGATAGIREDDARGRHTTTRRSLHPMTGGGWLIDTPGMRSLSVADASDGIDLVFEDITELLGTCRFRDCTHQSEPGCAIRLAVAEGRLDEARLHRWEKLARETKVVTQSTAQARASERRFGRQVRKSLALKDHLQGKRK
jgi:ribosome biogenesis GTPase / thiamine phosphate phosphatase